MTPGVSLTDQLQRFSGGDREMADVVLRVILPELHRIAARELGKERYVVPLQATELIDEVWLRSLRKGGWRIDNRSHFYAIAARAMRHVLVDYARHRRAQRRGDGGLPASLDEASLRDDAGNFDPERIVVMDILMERLQAKHPGAAAVVDMHYFAGYTLEEVAEKTGLNLRQIRHRWVKGRDWLKDNL